MIRIELNNYWAWQIHATINATCGTNQPPNHQMTDWLTETKFNLEPGEMVLLVEDTLRYSEKYARELSAPTEFKTPEKKRKKKQQTNYNNLDHTYACAPRDCSSMVLLLWLLLWPFRLVILIFLSFTLNSLLLLFFFTWNSHQFFVSFCCLSFIVQIGLGWVGLVDLFAVQKIAKRRRTDKYAINESKSKSTGKVLLRRRTVYVNPFPILSRTLFTLLFSRQKLMLLMFMMWKYDMYTAEWEGTKKATPIRIKRHSLYERVNFIVDNEPTKKEKKNRRKNNKLQNTWRKHRR